MAEPEEEPEEEEEEEIAQSSTHVPPFLQGELAHSSSSWKNVHVSFFLFGVQLEGRARLPLSVCDTAR